MHSPAYLRPRLHLVRAQEPRVLPIRLRLPQPQNPHLPIPFIHTLDLECLLGSLWLDLQLFWLAFCEELALVAKQGP
jgi:hypothetical protein